MVTIKTGELATQGKAKVFIDGNWQTKPVKYYTASKWNIVEEQQVEPENAFISKWKTDNYVNKTTDKQIKLPLTSSGTYDFYVYCDDLVVNPRHITSYNDAILTFNTAGIKTIEITGKILGFKFPMFVTDDRLGLLEISQCGCLEISDDEEQFNACINLNFQCTDVLKLNHITSTRSMFYNCTSLSSIPEMDTSTITDMSCMFQDCISFNHDISNWDVSNVSNMLGIFYNCKSFNQNLSSWDVSNVTSYSLFDEGATIWQSDYKPNFP